MEPKPGATLQTAGRGRHRAGLGHPPRRSPVAMWPSSWPPHGGGALRAYRGAWGRLRGPPRRARDRVAAPTWRSAPRTSRQVPRRPRTPPASPASCGAGEEGRRRGKGDQAGRAALTAGSIAAIRATTRTAEDRPHGAHRVDRAGMPPGGRGGHRHLGHDAGRPAPEIRSRRPRVERHGAPARWIGTPHGPAIQDGSGRRRGRPVPRTRRREGARAHPARRCGPGRQGVRPHRPLPLQPPPGHGGCRRARGRVLGTPLAGVGMARDLVASGASVSAV